jgi:hypothetical protein
MLENGSFLLRHYQLRKHAPSHVLRQSYTTAERNMRTPTACTQCRRAKRRCIRQVTSGTCISCKQRQQTCQARLQIQLAVQRPLVPRSPVPLSNSNSRQSSQQPERQLDLGLGLSHGTAIELVDHYLDKFHGRPHTIFHPATLRLMVRNGTLSKTLLYAICAIGCKFSGNPDTRGQGSDLAAESKRLLQADLLKISLENIQACILVATLSVGHGDSASEALFFRRECPVRGRGYWLTERLIASDRYRPDHGRDHESEFSPFGRFCH